MEIKTDIEKRKKEQLLYYWPHIKYIKVSLSFCIKKEKRHKTYFRTSGRQTVIQHNDTEQPSAEDRKGH